jgi:hypothetical protein
MEITKAVVDGASEKAVGANEKKTTERGRSQIHAEVVH